MADYIHRRRVWALAVAALAAALALGYLGTRESAPAPAASIDKLSIAMPMAPHAAMLLIAAEKGYFAAEGLEVTLTPVSHGKAGLDLVLQDKTDLATMSEVPFGIAVMKGENLGIAASMMSAVLDHAVVARRDRHIAAPRDLAGKKVGVTFGTSGEYFLWAFLIRHRIAADSVTLVNLGPGQIAQALAMGTIDAAATWQPIVSSAQSALGGNAASFTDANVYTETHVVVGRSDFFKARAVAMEKLMRALLKAEQFNRARPDEALHVVAGGLKIDVQALRPMWNDLKFEVNLLQSHLITLEEEARWAMARGYVATGPVPNFLPNLYLDTLLAVKPERVTVVR